MQGCPTTSAFATTRSSARSCSAPPALRQPQEPTIIEYADLVDEQDTKLRDLTAVERRRLGYAIALFCNPTVFLADEDLLSGSPAMRETALERLANYPDPSHALVVVTNNVKYLRRLCHRALVLRRGQLVFDGPLDEGIKEYRRSKQRKKKSSDG